MSSVAVAQEFNSLLQKLEETPERAMGVENAMAIWLMLDVLDAMQGGKIPRDRCLKESGFRLEYEYSPLNTRQPTALIKIRDGGSLQAYRHDPDFGILRQYGMKNKSPLFTCWRLNRKLVSMATEGGREIFYDPDNLMGDDPRGNLERIKTGTTFGQSNELVSTEPGQEFYQSIPTLNSYPAIKLRLKTASGHQLEIAVTLQIPITRARTKDSGTKVLEQDVYGGLSVTEGDPETLSDEEWQGMLATCHRLLCEDVFVPVITGDRKTDYFRTPGNFGFTPNQLASQPPSEESMGMLQEWRESQTPLDRAVGYAAFALTNPRDPGAMQRFSIRQLRDKVWPQKNHPKQWREDLCESLGRYQSQTLSIAKKDLEQHGRYWVPVVKCYDLTPLPLLGFVYLDTESGKEFNSTRGPGMRIAKKVTFPRRKREVSVKVIQQEKKKLIAVEIQWNQALVDWMMMEPKLDDKGRVLKDRRGKVIRKGSFFLLAQERFFDLNAAARTAKMDIAWDLFERLIYDRRRLEGSFEIAAPVLFRRMGWDWEDSNRRGRHKEQLERAIKWLKQEDVLTGASTEKQQNSKNPDRRKEPYYRFRFTPGWVKKIKDAESEVTDAAVIAQEDLETSADPAVTLSPAVTPETPKTPETSQAEFDLGVSSAAVPGAIVKRIRDAASLNVREWARQYGSSKSTWSKYESGLSSKPPAILPEKWQEIRILAENYNINISL